MESEFGGIFSKSYYKNMYRHYFTSYNEIHFDELRTNEELIPFRGLGSKSLDTSRNYSVSLEHQFEYFLKSAAAKKHLSQAYAIGQAIRFRINSPGMVNEAGESQMPDLDKWLELQMEKLLRNRVSNVSQIFSRALPFKLGGKDAPDEGLNFDLRKTLLTLGGLTSKILLGYRVFGGLKNQIFIDMYAIKEAVKNDVMTQIGKSTKFPGVTGEFVNFGKMGFVKGTGKFFGTQKDAMQGNLNKNKI